MNDQETEAVRQTVKELQIEHRDLDDVIASLSETPYPDQLQLRRLKKRKLSLKDQIETLRSKLIPDIDA